MKNILKTFDPNTRGRDFVIGDLHGAFPAFVNLLENIKFDSEVDRMFSVGDLVDRGPDSLNCLRLIREPWFHAVLSNHEQMMYQAFHGGYMGAYWFQNGGQWGLAPWRKYGEVMKAECNEHTVPDISDEEREVFELIDLVDELPFLITVNVTPTKKFHIIHAELPPGALNVTDEILSSPGKVDDLATTQGGDGDSFLWSRYLFRNFYNTNLENEDKVRRAIAYNFLKNTGPFNDKLSHIISGHTIIRRPITMVGQTNIDTCAYGSCADGSTWHGLTCINLHDWTFTKTTPSSHESVLPLEVNRSDLDVLRPILTGINTANHQT